MSEPANLRRYRGRLGRGTLTAILLHAQIVVPLLIATWIYADREAAQRAEEMDVSWEVPEPGQLPDNLPPIEDDKTAEDRRQDRREAKKRRKEPKVAAAPAAAPAPAPAPEPDVPVPPMPPMPPEPPPPPPMAHQTPVDLDMGKDVEPPPDAKYLAQKNNRTDVETRAVDTNLEKNQAGVEGSSPSSRKDPDIGDDVTKQTIAEVDDQKSALGKQAPQTTPRRDQQLGEQSRDTAAETLLAMRAEKRRMHEITPETADPSLPHEADGLRPLPDDRGSTSARAQAARLAGSGKRIKLHLTGKDYDMIFGAEADAERRLASTQKSKKPGRFSERLGRVRAALENFTPEVRPGKQTALNTRAHPFAAFVAQMHRSIHKLWGFGILEDWEGKPASSPFNDRHLAATLEIVLNPDGTIDKVTVVRASGYTPYDAAAIDVVYSAGPYPEPPHAIRSGNGKIYLHWQFRRDEFQCHPSGVDMYILDNAPKAGDVAGGGPGGEGGPQTGLPEMSRAPSTGSGLKRLSRAVPQDAAHQAKMRQLDAEAGGTPEPDAAAARQAAARVVHAEDPAARGVTERFFAGYARGDVAAMTAVASFPFRSVTGVAAATSKELTATFRALVDEAPAERRVRSLQVYSAAGMRGVPGGLPEGFGDGTGLLYGVARVGGDAFVLVLDKREGAWRAVGLQRR